MQYYTGHVYVLKHKTTNCYYVGMTQADTPMTRIKNHFTSNSQNLADRQIQSRGTFADYHLVTIRLPAALLFYFEKALTHALTPSLNVHPHGGFHRLRQIPPPGKRWWGCKDNLLRHYVNYLKGL